MWTGAVWAWGCVVRATERRGDRTTLQYPLPSSRWPPWVGGRCCSIALSHRRIGVSDGTHRNWDPQWFRHSIGVLGEGWLAAPDLPASALRGGAGCHFSWECRGVSAVVGDSRAIDSRGRWLWLSSLASP